MPTHVTSSKYWHKESRAIQWQGGRLLLNAIAVIVSVLALSPLIGLLGEGINGVKDGSIDLGIDG